MPEQYFPKVLYHLKIVSVRFQGKHVALLLSKISIYRIINLFKFFVFLFHFTHFVIPYQIWNTVISSKLIEEIW